MTTSTTTRPQSSPEKTFALTAYAAEFVAGTTWEDIPAEVMHLGKKSILDVLGCAVSGSIAPASDILRRYYAPFRLAADGATVIGTGLRLPARFAALVNGTAMHVDDFDDTQQAATGKFQGIHPTTPVFAALLAEAETSGASGRDVLVAYHVGAELACKLFDATAPAHILGGFHSTGTCGILGSAAAIARLKRFDQGVIETTLGIAASQAAGLSENFGTMTKPFHAGRSAENGILSADLAALGFTASQTILEAPRGFFSALGGGYERERIEDHLGAPWAFVDRGIWLKPWPTGSLGHPGMTLMQDLVEKHDIRPQDVAAIKVTTSENIYRTLLHHRPTTELEAKFSLEFGLAALLLKRRLPLAFFTDEFVREPALQALIALVDYRTFSEAEARAAGYMIVTTLIDIELKDGRRFSGQLDYGKGSLTNPMSDAEVEAKFLDCAAFAGWPEDKASKVADIVWNLERANIPALARCLMR
jgi:2-methylcitrate dehydratase PrpD